MGEGSDFCSLQRTPACWVAEGSGGKGLGTEPMEKVEQMGESLGWRRSPDSWDRGARRQMGEGKMRCSFWDGGPVRAASAAPGCPSEMAEHGYM